MPEASDSAILVRAVLHGGPADIPEPMRVRRVCADEQKIKLPWLGGYEHFERDAAAQAPLGAVVFRWTTRTRIAE